MSPASPDPPAGTRAAITGRERITNLDTVRGVATLGILGMNATAFALVPAAYFNLDAGGIDTWLDRLVGLAAEILVDQKMMGLFSLLFGVGIVVFADRAAVNGRRPVLLSLWRNLLLLGIGIVHAIAWEGDILVVYAVSSPVLLFARNRSPRGLLAWGSAMMVTAAACAVATQASLGDDGSGLGEYWFASGGPMSDTVGLFFLADVSLRALGMMLLGIGLFRLGVVQGRLDRRIYRRMTLWGLGVGLPVAAVGVVAQLLGDYSAGVALWTSAPNTLATVPVTLGYLGVLTLWNRRAGTVRHERIRAVGRMALTNYLSQTLIGITLFRVIGDRGDASRSGLVLFILAVWLLQYRWSAWWLARFRFGPVEWLWRCATYRKLQPMRRSAV